MIGSRRVILGLPTHHSPISMFKSLRSSYVWTLVRHEARVVRQNRMAGVLILFMLFAAAMLRFKDENQQALPRDVCYVLYWQEDDWVRRLQTAARTAQLQDGLTIEVVPACDLTGSDGIIRYPPGSHSIQLRPIEPSVKELDRSSGPNRRVPYTNTGRIPNKSPEAAVIKPGGWLVWYWYSGSDAAALFPYIQWFQRVTHEHFNDGMQWHVRASAMRPELVAFDKKTHVAVDSLMNPERVCVALVWLTLFFVGCHLSKLSLAQALSQRTIHSLAVTAAGWTGIAMAIRIFYGVFAVALAASMVAILKPELLLTSLFWLTAVCATVIYLGVGMTIACWCGSVASAGLGTAVYLAVSAMLYAAAVRLPASFATIGANYLSADAAILACITDIWNPDESQGGPAVVMAMIIWSLLWQITGALSYRRLKQG